MNEPCKCCDEDTSFGSGRFVNRVTSFDGGYFCADCCRYECDICGDLIPFDEDFWIDKGENSYRAHESCIELEDFQYIDNL